jgi:predicted GNAT family acetyltransferase
MSLDVIHDDANSRFSAIVDGHLCVIDYVLRDNTANFLHTGVPDAVGGRGSAGILTKFALEVARTKNWKVIPTCSYTAVYIQRHPEYSDLKI